MLLAADELQLTDLVDYLQEEIITNHIKYLKCHLVELLNTSLNLKSCKKLQQTITDHPELLFDTQDFVKLEHNFLESLLKQDKINTPEVKIWNKIIAWGITKTNGLTGAIDSWGER